MKRLEKEISDIEKEGFEYLQAWQMGFHAPDRIKLPSGNILDENELSTFFKKIKPEFGNKTHLEIMQATHYYSLIFSEKYSEKRFSYNSFADEEDEENCKRKYNPIPKI